MKKLKFKIDAIPSLVQIEVTYACNHKCIFCYNPQRDINIDFKKLDSVVEAIRKSSPPHVYFIGGEPSLVPINMLNNYIGRLSERSSVSIVTNGSIRMNNLKHNIANICIPLHGLYAEDHDALTNIAGSFDRTIGNIKYYVSNGYNVQCVFVLTGYNYNKMYQMLKFVSELGVQSVYIDRYEDAGFGAKLSGKIALKPTLTEFRIALGQIIDAKKDLNILRGRIGFGTAIPMCLDERILTENMASVCGAGTYFCAINPSGELRICNQSNVTFGNILKESLIDIWNKNSTKVFRDLSWVEEPCKSCKLLTKCQCGCKVDINYSDKFCIDYAVRGNIDNIIRKQIEKINSGVYDDLIFGEKKTYVKHTNKYKIFKRNKYLKLHNTNGLKLITRHQTISIDSVSFDIVSKILSENIVNEKKLVEFYKKEIEELEIRNFICNLVFAEALDVLGEVD